MRDIRLTAPAVAKEWALEVSLDGTSGAVDDNGMATFAGVTEGTHEVRMSAGQCDAAAENCWPDDCPIGCASIRHEITVSCDVEQYHVPLGSPRVKTSAVPAPVVVTPGPKSAGLDGLSVRVFHKADGQERAMEASKRLSSRGCDVRVERQRGSGNLDKFWGKIYYHREGLGGRAGEVAGVLAPVDDSLRSQALLSSDSEVDMTIWIE